MKKLIIYYAGIWAERLLTIDRYKKVDYFVDHIQQKEEFKGIGGEKNIYPIEQLLKENKDEILIVISDNRLYKEAKMELEDMGFTEGIHFFNGWRLDYSFYKLYYDDSSWGKYENEQDGAIERADFNQRAKMMAQLIPDDVRSVMDLGCGSAFLKNYISSDIQYYGLDYCERDSDTIVCDLNKEPLPDINVDMYYMAGLVYYIDDMEHFIAQMTNAKYILFDYGGTERYLRLDGVPEDPLINARNNFIEIDKLFVILRRNGFVFENGNWDWKNGKIGWHMYLFKKLQ